MLEFESEPDAEFAFFLAEKLGRTTAEIDEMPHDEFVKWIVYYGRKAQRREIERAKAKGRR
jgi:hypothetical protein